MSLGWSDERVELLKQLVAKGLSGSQIAARLGGFEHCVDQGRSAVIGKIMRLREKGVIPPMTQSEARCRQREGGLKGSRASHIARARIGKIKPLRARSVAPEVFEPIPTGPELVIPIEERVDLIGLEPHHCRFPIGDPRHAFPDFYFCGRDKVPGTSYCAHHLRVCFVSPEQQKAYLAARRKSRKREAVDA